MKVQLHYLAYMADNGLQIKHFQTEAALHTEMRREMRTRLADYELVMEDAQVDALLEQGQSMSAIFDEWQIAGSAFINDFFWGTETLEIPEAPTHFFLCDEDSGVSLSTYRSEEEMWEGIRQYMLQGLQEVGETEAAQSLAAVPQEELSVCFGTWKEESSQHGSYYHCGELPSPEDGHHGL